MALSVAAPRARQIRFPVPAMSQLDSRSPQERRRATLQALLRSDLPPRAFWERLLAWIVEAVDAEGALWWRVAGDGIKPETLCGSAELRAAIGRRTRRQVSHVFQAVASEESVAVNTGTDGDEPLPSRTLLALPLRERGQPSGAIECVFGQPISAEQIALRQRVLEEVVAEIAAASEASAAPQPVERHDAGGVPFERIAFELHRSLLIPQVADVAANDGKLLLGCDRLSVAVLRGRRTQIQAVSGQDQVNRRSEEIRSLTALARAALDVREPLRFCGTTEQFSPGVETLLTRHVELTAARLILVVPLYAPPPKQPPDADDRPDARPKPRPIGCLIVEQFAENRLPESAEERLGLLADQLGAALGNAIAHQNVWLLPLRRWLGRGIDWFRGRLLAKTLLVLGVLAAVTLALVFVPCEYRVEADGQLFPVEQRRVFTPWDGVVSQISVQSGQKVSAGTELLRVYNDELHASRVATESELLEKRQLLLSLQAEIDTAARQGDRRAELQLKGKLQETRLQLIGLDEQLAILVAREESLVLRAPIDGVVATFQVEELLLNRPVARGELLLEVMDEAQEWRLELHVPEYRMGHLLRASQRAEGGVLDVEYVLATDAVATFRGRLTPASIATRSEVAGDAGTVVRIHVETAADQLPLRRIGAQATAKINCGRRSLGYVLFGDVWEFLERFFWM